MVKKNIFVSFAFIRRTPVYRVSFGRNVVTKLTGNANYLTPNPTLAAFTALLDTADAAIEAALNRGKQEILDRDAIMADVDEALRQLGAYVQGHCQNDLAILGSSGFEAIKPRTPVGPLPTSLPPKMEQTKNSGRISGRVKKIHGAYAYNWRLALASAPDVYVQTSQTTGARAFFEGLTPGEVYNLEVQALGAAGASSWSNAGCIRVV